MLPGGLLSAPPPSIEALSAHERGQLETALMQRFLDGSHNMLATTADGEVANLPTVPPMALEAMQAWLMVQSARLRHIDPTIVERTATPEFLYNFLNTSSSIDHGQRVDMAQVRQEAHAHIRASLDNTHPTRIRPEYANALNNFLRVLEPNRPLHPVLHSQVVAAFNNHRLEGRISPQVAALVDAHGIEALAEQGYELSRTGKFRSRDERWGRTPPRTPEHAMVPRPSGEGSSSAASRPEPVQQPPALRLNPQGELWMNRTLGLSTVARARTGKLPDSEQYQHIKSMPANDRAFLEATLESLFMPPVGTTPAATAWSALEGWLTAQQVRLRVHSKASLKQHAKMLLLHSFGNAAKVVKAKLGGSQSQSQSEFSRFHSEHESANRPEYAIALNNFLRVLHPNSPLSPELKEHVAGRLMYHAETEGTISDQVLGELKGYGPLRLAAEGWKLDPLSNDFSPPPQPVRTAIGHDDKPISLAVPSPFRHTPRTPPRR